MAFREGRWDCPSCGSTGVYGRHVECPSCGKPRPEGVRFYLTDDAPVLVDPERIAEAQAGPDWACEHCGASNRDGVEHCQGCGAPRGSSPVQGVADYTLDNVPRSGKAPQGIAGPPKKKGNACCGCGCLLALVALVAPLLLGAIIALFPAGVGGEDLIPAVVVAKSWERTVALEERNVVREDGWELPDSARLIRKRREVQRYDQVVDHYEPVTRHVRRTERVSDGTRTRTREVSERVRTGTRTYVCGHRDRGNGYFEDVECSEPVYETRTRSESYEEPSYRDESHTETETDNEPVYRRVPVHGTHYYYRIPRWTPSRTLRAQGAADEPAWPVFTPRRNEREAERTQRYEVTFRETEGMKPHTVQYPDGVWRRFRVGDRVALRLNRGEPVVLPADSLSECRRWVRDGGAPPDSMGCVTPPARK